MNFKSLTLLTGALLLMLQACRKDELPIPPEEQQPVGDTASATGSFYLLNEGNMGSNKSTLDFYNAATGIYHRNLFAERNPGVVKALGDVGNDLAVYGSKLYAVINASHLVEVMDVHTAQHIAKIDITNCRYITFYDGKAYVSSYAGPIQLDPHARPGKVVEIDTLTLAPTREVVVGYQPEEMAITDGKLFVANSGGYRIGNYDRTVSVVDLATFTLLGNIDVAPNLHRMRLDPRSGMLVVTSRGNYADTPADTYLVDPHTRQTVKSLGLPAHNIRLAGDSLYAISSGTNGTSGKSFVLYDLTQQRILKENFITDGTDTQIRTPYGLAVNPWSKEILVTDAGNYVTPGKLYCFGTDGVLKWSVETGDIPAHIAFIEDAATANLSPTPVIPEQPLPTHSPYLTRVLEYCPAPGQFVNRMPPYEAGDTPNDMCSKVQDEIADGRGGVITLGGFGGYVTVGFDHTIINKVGQRDFLVRGNTFLNNSEPGVIQVAYDRNGNGIPDSDEWYEIAGSAHRGDTEEWTDKARTAGNDLRLLPHYEVTYYAPATEPAATDSTARARYIRWRDNHGTEGFLPQNNYNRQSYYPQWVNAHSLTLGGTRLPQNGINEAEKFAPELHRLYSFAYGYADNLPNNDPAAAIDIDWAVDADGQPAHLPGVNFIRVYTGVMQVNGWVGECSTEISGIEDLHVSHKLNR
ncbi:MAG: hypothetical protein LBM62_05625 [Mediterranea sp.]|jgi:DNA-binding beta-propeller fold protein YncE|nr:hypothetical protein [Mediterranea sp.]